ncbi:hypothetical protein ACM614_28675 [Streptomyces sp. 12297]
MTTADLETAMDTELLLRVDGTLPPSAEAAAALNALCDRAEASSRPSWYCVRRERPWLRGPAAPECGQ